jgi:hypothetical protein
VVLCFSCAYRMVVETLAVVQFDKKIRVVSIPIEYPVVDETKIVNSFIVELQRHDKVAFCIIDHVSSQVSA